MQTTSGQQSGGAKRHTILAQHTQHSQPTHQRQVEGEAVSGHLFGVRPHLGALHVAAWPKGSTKQWRHPGCTALLHVPGHKGVLPVTQNRLHSQSVCSGAAQVQKLEYSFSQWLGLNTHLSSAAASQLSIASRVSCRGREAGTTQKMATLGTGEAVPGRHRGAAARVACSVLPRGNVTTCPRAALLRQLLNSHDSRMRMAPPTHRVAQERHDQGVQLPRQRLLPHLQAGHGLLDVALAPLLCRAGQGGASMRWQYYIAGKQGRFCPGAASLQGRAGWSRHALAMLGTERLWGGGTLAPLL